eukprot:GHVL01012301.1.p1 GENE.GHVL01012301.1~~GHVL01012301.1.p1  ORF type:complete len:140 (-),score=20.96 GHVL01012301.1:135-554(-)
MRVGEERFTAPEVLFHPERFYLDQRGIPDVIMDSIDACALDSRREYCHSILLTGGGSFIRGFAERITKELCLILQRRNPSFDFQRSPESLPRAFRAVNPLTCAFQGACVMADAMASNPSWWLTRSQWEEEGERILEEMF